MLITFSGLDGAGKSTLIASLKAALEERKRPVTVLHMHRDIGLYAWVWFIRDTIKGSIDGRSKEGRRNETEQAEEHAGEQGRAVAAVLRVRRSILWHPSVRGCVYLVDLLLFQFYRLYIEQVKNRIFITDRYFYDRLADLSNGGSSGGGAQRGAGPRALAGGVRLLERLIPTPDIAIFVDVTPEEAYARKEEHSLPYLNCRQRTYQKLFARIEGAVILVNDELNATKRALENVVMDRLAVEEAAMERRVAR